MSQEFAIKETQIKADYEAKIASLQLEMEKKTTSYENPVSSAHPYENPVSAA